MPRGSRGDLVLQRESLRRGFPAPKPTMASDDRLGATCHQLRRVALQMPALMGWRSCRWVPSPTDHRLPHIPNSIWAQRPVLDCAYLHLCFAAARVIRCEERRIDNSIAARNYTTRCWRGWGREALLKTVISRVLASPCGVALLPLRGACCGCDDLTGFEQPWIMNGLKNSHLAAVLASRSCRPIMIRNN